MCGHGGALPAVGVCLLLPAGDEAAALLVFHEGSLAFLVDAIQRALLLQGIRA